MPGINLVSLWRDTSTTRRSLRGAMCLNMKKGLDGKLKARRAFFVVSSTSRELDSRAEPKEHNFVFVCDSRDEWRRSPDSCKSGQVEA